MSIISGAYCISYLLSRNLAGKVLVNCMMGVSRSSTCVLAYLMLRCDMSAVDALTEIRR